MQITIDGKIIEAKEGQSVLDASLDAGIYIPHLCSHPDLEAKGGCRLCSVEIEGTDKPVPSCETAVEDGMVIKINGPEANRIRKSAMELILATHPADCTGCPKYGKCELQSMYQYLGVSPQRWRNRSRSVPNDDSNPLIEHLFTRCVRCGRCIRACEEMRGVGILDYVESSVGIHAGIEEGMSLEDADCRFCGACIEVCPTGSIMDALSIMKEERTYIDNVVPCRATCPAHIDIPRYIRHIKDGEFPEATAVIREKVPFPEVLGSICSHPCEAECKRQALKNPVSICKLKRAAAVEDDKSWKQNERKDPDTGKKVAVIGAGPGGLTGAYYLAKKGHQVTVFEKNQKAGGQLRYGIPAYRLPDELLDKEIEEILSIGIELKTENQVLPKELLKEGFDSVLVATGTHIGGKIPIPGSNLEKVYVNTDFLKGARLGQPLEIGNTVMVLGGGNVAFDCARTAVRLGAKKVYLVCLEARDKMLASKEEIEEALEEGVEIIAGNAFLSISGEKEAKAVQVQEVERFFFDENRKPVRELKEGTNRFIDVDSVIFAVGQKPELTTEMGLDLAFGPYIAANDNQETSEEGIYACGDVVTGTKSVIDAIAGGRKAAESIDAFLGGDGDIGEILTEHVKGDPFIGKIEDFSKLHRVEPEIVSPQVRKDNFNLVELPFSCQEAKCEAERCLQCDLRLDITRPKLWNEY